MIWKSYWAGMIVAIASFVIGLSIMAATVPEQSVAFMALVIVSTGAYLGGLLDG